MREEIKMQPFREQKKKTVINTIDVVRDQKENQIVEIRNRKT